MRHGCASEPDFRVTAFAIHDGRLFTGGIRNSGFTQSVAVWDAAAQAWAYLPSLLGGSVTALTSYNGRLLAGGDLSAIILGAGQDVERNGLEQLRLRVQALSRVLSGLSRPTLRQHVRLFRQRA